MTQLSSNADLYRYLLVLDEELRLSGLADLADLVRSAQRHASGMSTEFLGETRAALRQVLPHRVMLGEQASANLLDVVKQLDSAFEGRSRR